MQRDIRSLRADMREAQKGLDQQKNQLDAQMERAEEKINEVNGTLQDLNRAARMTDADFGVQMEQMRRELQDLRGQLELVNYRLNQLEGSNGQIAAPESPQVDPSPSGSQGPDPKAKKPPKPKDKAGLLAEGKRLAKAGQLEDARGVFREVIRRWPKSSGSTDDAYFQLGELYYRDKNFRSALQEYIKIVERFGKGKFADDAYYRIGLCSIELGNLEDAKIFFEEIIKNHKGSPLVKSAKAKLRDVNKRLDKEKRKKK